MTERILGGRHDPEELGGSEGKLGTEKGVREILLQPRAVSFAAAETRKPFSGGADKKS